jgi:hypothetical protein
MGAGSGRPRDAGQRRSEAAASSWAWKRLGREARWIARSWGRGGGEDSDTVRPSVSTPGRRVSQSPVPDSVGSAIPC